MMAAWSRPRNVAAMLLSSSTRLLVIAAIGLWPGCGGSHGVPGDGGGRAGDGGGPPGDGGGPPPGDGALAIDAALTYTPITCPGPGTPHPSGSTCGSERWPVKVGTDAQAAGVSLAPKPTTVATLDALAAAGGGASRETPTETTLWELRDVTLTEIKLESDDDYHLVVSQAGKTMIVEVPSPGCARAGAWACLVSRTRSAIDGKYTVTASPSYPAATVTMRGIGFFDYPHGQTGVAPNAIELHPVLQICFGAGCVPT
jgi:hypothetical protein